MESVTLTLVSNVVESGYDNFVDTQDNVFLRGLAFIGLALGVVLFFLIFLGIIIGLFFLSWKVGFIAIAVIAIFIGICELGSRI